MSEAALLESLVGSLGSNSDVVREGAVQPTVPQPDATPLPPDLDPFTNPPSPTKRRASLESEIPTAKRIKMEPGDETSLVPSSEPVETSVTSSAGAIMPASPPSQPTTAPPPPSVTPTTTAESLPPTAPVIDSMSAAPMASGALAPPTPSPAPAHTPIPAPMATPTTTDTPIAAAAPIPSIEKSPSVNLESGKYSASPGPAKDNATPDVQMANTEAPAATPAPPRKRRRMLEAPGQALRGMNMQLLGIQAVQVLEWLSQEPFEEVIDALRDFESEVYASYSFKVAQFEQAWRNFSATEDLLEWSRMGLGDQKHRKTVRLANLARFAIDLFSEDESCLPSLHERFYRVFVYGTRKFTLDHSNILLELKTQLALYLLTEGDKEKPPADVLQEVFLGGLQAKLQERCWNMENFNEETAMVTSAEIRMSLLLHEFEESGGNTLTLAERYPLDSLLRQLGSYMHGELVAHSDHCQTLVFSSRTAGKGPAEPRSLAYQDDDDYWQRTTKLIDDLAASITVDSDAQATPATSATSELPASEANVQALATSNSATQSQSLQAGLTNTSTPPTPVSAPVELGEQLRADIDRLKEFMNQKIASREAEIARASLPPTPLPPPVPLDSTAQNLYLLNKATQGQQPMYTQRGSATPQTPNPAPPGAPHVPIPGHPQGHVPRPPHPIGDAPNQMTGQGQPTEQPLAPGELPPNQTCPTSMLYDKARQAALSKSATHTRREGIHSTRRPWTPEEEKALMTGLDMVKGPHWSQILSLFGPNGTISDVLKDRTQVQLKDKARNLKLFFLKTQSEMPYYLSAVTGELKTRAPNQAARKEAEERARLSREEEQVKAQGAMAALPGQMQSSPHVQAGQGGAVRPPHTGVVTPAQAALAAQITTPAMAQGQAQSAQRPIQAAHPSLSTTTAAKEPHAMTPNSTPMAGPTPASMHGGATSAPVAQSQPHNRPSDGTVAALQELARASAISSMGTPTPRMSSQAPAQAQAQVRNGATTGFQNASQGQGQHWAPAPQAPQAHQVHQAHQAHQVHQTHQTQAQVAQARLQASSSPQPRPQLPVQPQGQNQAQARISASPGVSGQAFTPTAATAAPSSTTKSTAMPSPAPTTQAQAPATTAAPSTATVKTQTASNATPSARTQPPVSNPPASSPTPPASALAQLQAHQSARSTPMTLSQSFPSTIPANLFSRVTEAEATNSGLLEKLRAEMARDTRS
ncbi:uncharacterized protein DNG_06556 [Cephalotrichum gorgonifer]|uniref:HTH myb-type domain-containing protein n=1 Tax=Cephalotrichum gorgonifer TaxID=2041049 RepID=A0AAE8N1T4_9PEZI|nr:uncharacterized protein DNG_06556 [Cephalotrichum gorgonifer]